MAGGDDSWGEEQLRWSTLVQMADSIVMTQPWGATLGPLARLLQTLGLDLSGSEHLAPLMRPAPAVPAFTIILRTQGRRRRTLREALQSLAAQTWTSFDAIVAVHAAAEVAAEVEADVAAAAAAAAAPADWRVLPVGAGGSRSRPLNAGLEAADGDYVTFLDDDDLAEPNWLAVFARAAADAPGQIIRARTAWQPWLTDGTAEPQTPAGPVDHITLPGSISLRISRAARQPSARSPCQDTRSTASDCASTRS